MRLKCLFAAQAANRRLRNSAPQSGVRSAPDRLPSLSARIATQSARCGYVTLLINFNGYHTNIHPKMQSISGAKPRFIHFKNGRVASKPIPRHL
jgi:hypothetical protein